MAFKLNDSHFCHGIYIRASCTVPNGPTIHSFGQNAPLLYGCGSYSDNELSVYQSKETRGLGGIYETISCFGKFGPRRYSLLIFTTHILYVFLQAEPDLHFSRPRKC